jgi:multiple sugar transport system substrate-binding protein
VESQQAHGLATLATGRLHLSLANHPDKPKGPNVQHGQPSGERVAVFLMIHALVLTLVCGCSQPPEPPPSPDDRVEASQPLRVIVVDDPGLAEAVQLQWQARAEGEIEVRQMSVDELLDARRKRLGADAVIYPSGLIGELAERDWIVPIAKDVFNGPEFGRRDILEQIRQHEIVWGERVFAVPLGSPQLTLIYDAERFRQQGVDPPQTWQQYAELCQRLSTSEDETDEGPPHYSVAEPLGPGWAGQVLLARAATYARHRSYFATLFDLDTMEPLIASPPFVKALEELVASAKHGPEEAIEYSPADVRRLLTAGGCSMGLSWPSSADSGRTEASPQGAPAVSLAAAELPGSGRVYYVRDGQWQDRESAETWHVPLLALAGRMGSVVKGARRSSAALGMLLRLSGPEWSAAISPQSPATTLYRNSQMKDAAAWVGDGFQPDAVSDYAELTREALRRPLSVVSVRLPGRRRYLDALDAAVHTAIRSDQSPDECLEEAARRWRTITEEFGVQEQKAAYWRSLGMEP